MKRVRWLHAAWVCLALLVPLAGRTYGQGDADDELVKMVLELLTETDKDLRALGLEQVRTEAKGEAATRQFAALLSKLPAEAQVALIRALADRGDRAARPALLELLAAGSEQPVGSVAIEGLGKLGQAEDLPLLLTFLSDGSPAEQLAARTSLVRLPGEAIAAMIVSKSKSAPAARRVALIEILAARRAVETLPDLLAAAVDDDATVRTAAMTALGQLAGAEHLAGMIQGVLKAQQGREREAAEKAVMFVCQRIKDEPRRSDALLGAVEQLDAADRLTILPTLGRVGGPAARSVVEAAVRDPDPVVHDAGLRALCSWPDASVADRLMLVVKEDEHEEHRTMALRALIRIAPLPDGRSEAEKLQLIRITLSLCTDDAQRNLALQRAAAIRNVETLRLLAPYLDQPACAQAACQGVVELAHHRDLRQANKGEFDQALDKVIEISQDATVVDRANRYKKGQTWVRPKTPPKSR